MKTEEEFDVTCYDLIEESSDSIREIERIIFTKLYGLSEKHFSILAVQSIAMLYAVWERFVQKVFGYYVEYLNSLNISYNILDVHIVKYNNEAIFKQFKDYPSDIKKRLQFHEKLTKHYTESNYIELRKLIDTESNVGFDVLNKLLIQFNLEPFPERWSNYNHPLPTLKESMKDFLNYRNTIAHGGDLASDKKITQEIYNFYRGLVLDLMYAVIEKMWDGIAEKRYLSKEYRLFDLQI